MTFINTHIQLQAHREHGKHFTVSLQGSLRYNPHHTQQHPRRITSKDLIDVRPDIHQLDTIASNLVEEHCKQIHEGIWILTHKHQHFGKNLALSYQNKEKHRFSKRMWPFGQKTHTHTQVKSPPSDPCAI